MLALLLGKDNFDQKNVAMSLVGHFPFKNDDDDDVWKDWKDSMKMDCTNLDAKYRRTNGKICKKRIQRKMYVTRCMTSTSIFGILGNEHMSRHQAICMLYRIVLRDIDAVPPDFWFLFLMN